MNRGKRSGVCTQGVGLDSRPGLPTRLLLCDHRRMTFNLSEPQFLHLSNENQRLAMVVHYHGAHRGSARLKTWGGLSGVAVRSPVSCCKGVIFIFVRLAH